MRMFLIALVAALPTVATAQQVAVVTASYGQNCSAQNADNATADLRSRCDGKRVCPYTVDASHYGGPSPTCKGAFAARWNCGGNKFKRGAINPESNGRSISVSCP
jgi:hypothetical protein